MSADDFTAPDTPEELFTLGSNPPDDLRESAVKLRGFFTSLRDAGFTETQAMMLVAATVQAAMNGGNNSTGP